MTLHTIYLCYVPKIEFVFFFFYNELSKSPVSLYSTTTYILYAIILTRFKKYHDRLALLQHTERVEVCGV